MIIVQYEILYKGDQMEHLIFAYIVISYSSGLLSLIVLILAYLKSRSKWLLYLLCFLIMETLQLLYLGYFEYLCTNNIPILFRSYHFVAIYGLISLTIVVLPMLANELCKLVHRRSINGFFGFLFLIGLGCIAVPYYKGYIDAGISFNYFISYKIFLVIAVAAALYAFLTLILNTKNIDEIEDQILYWSLAFIILITASQLLLPIFKRFPESVLIFATCYLLLNLILLRYLIHKFFNASGPLQRGSVVEFITNQRITNREKEILTLIAQGMTNKEIGMKLFITETTVKTHTKNIYKKLGVRNRIQLFNLLREKTNM